MAVQRCIEVVARLGDTILDVAQVAASGTYRIGTSPGVELPIDVAPITSFPIVDKGFVLRRPAGVFATVVGAATPLEETELRLAPGSTVELRIGLVTIVVALGVLARAPVPRM
jgi:hypothetical protein